MSLWFGSEQFAARVDNSIGALTRSDDTFRDAIGHRYWIARGALNMIRHNPVNGVGAGSFRYAFPQYAAADDPFFHAQPPITPYHAHNVVLQVLAETGAIGALGLLCLLALLLLSGIRARRESRPAVAASAIGARPSGIPTASKSCSGAAAIACALRA